MIKLAVVLLLIPVLASAEPEPWMKKDDPNELFVNYDVASACPFSVERVQKTIDDVLVRSQIKPIDEPQHLNLTLDIQCRVLSGEKYSTMLTADFYRVVKVDEEVYWARMGASRHAGRIGMGGDDAIVDAIQNLLEDVIADYLRVNFDLDE